MNKGILVFVGIIIALGLVFVSQYNRLVRADLDVDIKWVEVENQFQRRVDLVPDLVRVANRVAEHEKEVVDRVLLARAKLAEAIGVQEKISANNELDSAISNLLVIVENYPEIKADQAFIRLMDEMAGTENRIAVARQNYNNSVGAFNTKLRVIPTSWIAGAFGFESRAFYEISEEIRVKPYYDI